LGIDKFDYRSSSQTELSSEQKDLLTELQKEKEEEIKHNQDLIVKKNRTPLKYGDLVNFVHINSNKYLNILREPAELQKDSFKIHLDSDLNPQTVFRILPYFKFKQEGETV
jgi:hypothetical protein